MPKRPGIKRKKEKMNMKRKGKPAVSVLLAAVLMAFALFTACGNNSSNNSTSPTAANTAETTPGSENPQSEPTDGAENVVPAVNKYPDVQKTSIFGGYTQDMSIIERSL